MIETTHETNGRVGVIVPHGVLFRGSSEKTIRQQLIEENLLEAVIGLPANLFYGTSIPAAILIFNRAKGANTDVLFVDASKAYESGKNQNHLRDEDISHIVSVYQNYKKAKPINAEKGSVIEERFAYRATLAEIEANDYNLNIPRYVDTFEPETLVDIATVHSELGQLKQELSEVEQQIERYLKELNLV